ncbi:MAG: hypothetical protein B7Y36_18315 [Novosphingobium sp. 28-62-57]|nr:MULTISPECIES: GpE family phage tail protein [unclassified Novosphingobium]OYW47323.1 MAG: hypothetical protein B7Z36_03925 [Novosphingobium sp. 12-63-9]OYZ07991.1 MAG: hypothetical protein B7Y36_18315 [Novosphingobium sp. 28-62-57]HQS69252.1 GpE family phage tail protein [Novosphingobium sp.]
MADIAAIFHWPKAELAAMTLPELIDWRERAVACWNRMQGKGEGD